MGVRQWFWMMNYCKKNGLPPAQSWAWNRANDAFNKHQASLPTDTLKV